MIRLAIRVRREQSEVVLAELLELAPRGVEEVERGGIVEYAVYGASGELPTLPDLRAAAGDALVEVSTQEIAEDWADRWREFHKPLVLDGRLTVRPPWEPRGETPVDLVIDPGRAFGTGAHATTRMCLELMLSLRAVGPFVDLGCGSGVLAIAAARLGFGPVLAVDNDPAALEATQANAASNGVTLDVRRVDLRAEPVPLAPTVVANLVTPLLIPSAPALAQGTERVIASGILGEETDRVVSGFTLGGLREQARLQDGGWVALLFETA
ncbi:MAG TPA: 50S ribosomal protein L11 methyltransferase [Solirubrobacteraceae bacterium]